MDEAGLIHSSSRVLPLRNLTLGVLLVAGGTLAALPFRHVGSVPDASGRPPQATGPTLTELQLRAGAPELAQSIAPPSGFDPVLAEALPTWRPPRDRSRSDRHFDAPLSFDDLMAPIATPEPIRRRYDATVPVSQADAVAKADRQNAFAAAQPFDPITTQPSPMTPPRFEQFSDQVVAAKPPVAGSLASTMSSSPSQTFAQPSTDRLPKPTIAPDDRHWIRQP